MDRPLETDNNRLRDPDEAYRALIEAHRGLSDEASAELNARLVLVLASQIGSIDVLRAAIALAKASSGASSGK